ncbi:MAG TPA: N-acetyl-gamma-glutamyl-phosphate reductase [Gemmatimonadaceae bacterium]|nr:N-acetyl-gamma-glutamyl-phosphate reductase [Gemmatimonadaceae bacterium]
MHKIPVGVLGASGYAGRELCQLVLRHPALELSFATANERRGQVATIAGRDVRFVATDDAPLAAAELVFSSLPHGASAEWVARASGEGCRVVDLSSDLRPGTIGAPEAPYGLTELVRPRIPEAAVVANPGCYPTAILLALAPLLSRGLVERGGTVSIVAASGVTGAGASPRPDLLFAEIVEDYRAYAIGNSHRHLPEMRAMVAELGADVDLVFTPHLLPVSRGILATITVPLADPLPDVMAPWRESYAGEPFIELSDRAPSLRDVVGRNVVRIHATPLADVRRPTLLIVSAIDNLMKGAAGQAVQNGNLMLGVPETQGLPS